MLKKKLVDNEKSLEVQGKEIKQLKEEADDQYIVGYSRACLDSLQAFRNG